MKGSSVVASPPTPARTLSVAVGIAAGCLLVIRLCWVGATAALDAVTASGPDSPADLLALGAATLGGALVAWLGLGAVVAALAALPGAAGRAAAHSAARLAPVVVRRTVALALGSALAAGGIPGAWADDALPTPGLGPVATSQARPAPAPDPAFTTTGARPVADAVTRQPPGPADVAGSTAAPDPGFTVSSGPRAAAYPTPAATTRHSPTNLGPLGSSPRAATSPATAAGSVTVRRGDSLWRIAARHLGPGATTREVAGEWPRWYAANRAVIGPDPNRIRVGQVLAAPAATVPEGSS